MALVGVSRALISRLGPRAATRSLVSVGRVPDAPKIGLLTLEKGPVNSLDTSMLDAIRAGVGELENAGDVKAFVLTSKFDGTFTIGLNEAQFGLVAPDFFLDVYRNTVGQRNAEWLAGTGALLPPKAALAVNLVDEVVDQADALPAAVAAAAKLAELPFDARAETKRRLRLKTATDLVESRPGAPRSSATSLRTTSRPLAAYVASLKQRKAA
ncbi:enoyl-CoA hydratase [Aureococcus anophagefferens]|nr:enoyl-CoA hydratase [Aureococcus anophagefferens]